MPFGLGIGEILVIVLLVMLLFGAKKIPGIARGLGQGIRNFKGEVKGGRDEENRLGDGRNADHPEDRDRP